MNRGRAAVYPADGPGKLLETTNNQQGAATVRRVGLVPSRRARQRPRKRGVVNNNISAAHLSRRPAPCRTCVGIGPNAPVFNARLARWPFESMVSAGVTHPHARCLRQLRQPSRRLRAPASTAEQMCLRCLFVRLAARVSAGTGVAGACAGLTCGPIGRNPAPFAAAFSSVSNSAMLVLVLVLARTAAP